MKMLLMAICLMALTACATVGGILDVLSPPDPPECAQLKSFMFKSPVCPSGYLVPYASGPASCLELPSLKEIKTQCPNF